MRTIGTSKTCEATITIYCNNFNQNAAMRTLL